MLMRSVVMLGPGLRFSRRHVVWGLLGLLALSLVIHKQPLRWAKRSVKRYVAARMDLHDLPASAQEKLLNQALGGAASFNQLPPHLQKTIIDKMPFRDVSTEPLLKGEKLVPGKVWLVNYGDGDPTYSQSCWFQIQTCLNRGVEGFMHYTRKDLPKEFLEKHKAYLSYKKGAGYWVWKPYIVLQALKNIPEGDVLIYADSTMTAHGSLLPLVNLLKDHDLVCFQANNHNHLDHPKPWQCDPHYWEGRSIDHGILEQKMIWAGMFAVKNTKEVRQFMRAWLDYTADTSLLHDPKTGLQDENMLGVLHDQTIFSLLLWKNMKRGWLPGLKVRYETSPLCGHADNRFFFWHHIKEGRGTLIGKVPNP